MTLSWPLPWLFPFISQMPPIERFVFSAHIYFGIQKVIRQCKLNLPYTITLSDKRGHFFSIMVLTRSASGHTTVSQTGFFKFFLKVVFDHNVSGHTTVCQTGVFFYILDLDVNDHTVSQTRSVVWSMRSYVEKVTKKLGCLCQDTDG